MIYVHVEVVRSIKTAVVKTSNSNGCRERQVAKSNKKSLNCCQIVAKIKFVEAM